MRSCAPKFPAAASAKDSCTSTKTTFGHEVGAGCKGVSLGKDAGSVYQFSPCQPLAAIHSLRIEEFWQAGVLEAGFAC